MNYIKVFSRGLKYVNDAGNNWHGRKQKLISAWVAAEVDYNKRTPKKQRINKIIGVLDERINTLSKTLFVFKENQKRQQLEAQEQYIMLECPKFECRYNPDAVGIGVKVKDYEHGKYKCEKCGSELMSKDDIDIDLMLFELGVSRS